MCIRDSTWTASYVKAYTHNWMGPLYFGGNTHQQNYVSTTTTTYAGTTGAGVAANYVGNSYLGLISYGGYVKTVDQTMVAYEGTYNKTYEKDWIATYTRDYSADYNKIWSKDWNVDYSVNYLKLWTKNWVKDYSTDYIKAYVKTYTKVWSTNYTKSYASQVYSREVTRSFMGSSVVTGIGGGGGAGFEFGDAGTQGSAEAHLNRLQSNGGLFRGGQSGAPNLSYGNTRIRSGTGGSLGHYGTAGGEAFRFKSRFNNCGDGGLPGAAIRGYDAGLVNFVYQGNILGDSNYKYQ